jgi:hypothetical protein
MWRKAVRNALVLLRYEKIPQVLVALMAAFGWSLSRIGAQWAEAPILEYRMTTRPEGAGHLVQLEVANISKKNVIKDLSIGLSFPRKEAEVLGVSLIPYPPAGLRRDPDESPLADASSFEKHDALFKVVCMQPGTRYRMDMQVSSSSWPVLRCANQGDEPMVLVRAGIKTWCLKYEVELLWASSLVLLLLMLTHVIAINPVKEEDR